MHPKERYGCSENVTLISKKIFSKLEMVSLGLIRGGEEVTFEMVSRIDTREGTIGLPVIVISQ